MSNPVTAVFGTVYGKPEWKLATVDVTVGNKTNKCAYWKSAPWADQIAEGTTLEGVVIEMRPKRDNPDVKEPWIAAIGGVSDQKPKAGGGGGRGNWQPKTVLEIHSSCVAGIIKSYLEAVGKDKTTNECQAFISLYFDNLKGVV